MQLEMEDMEVEEDISLETGGGIGTPRLYASCSHPCCTITVQNRWLALHGFLDNAASYDKLAPELLKIGASSVVCLDFAGHGKSDWRHSGVYYVVDHVADAVYAADALKWDKFSIIGHSLGGGVAQGVAAACPDRVLRVVSIEALSWWPQVGASHLLHLCCSFR